MLPIKKSYLIIALIMICFLGAIMFSGSFSSQKTTAARMMVSGIPVRTTGETITYGDLIREEQESLARLLRQTETVLDANGSGQVVLSAQTSQPEGIKAKIKIVVFGDSMTETMGDFSYLKKELDINDSFDLQIYNLGVGAETIDKAYRRITVSGHSTVKAVPSLISYQPDIILVESFAYNPIPEEEYRYWLGESLRLISTASSAKIYLMTAIAPNCQIFGDGPKGVNWEKKHKEEQCLWIKRLMRIFIDYAKAKKLPLADSYSVSLDNGNEGEKSYISLSDGIHPSPAGAEFISRHIAERLRNDILTSYD